MKRAFKYILIIIGIISVWVGTFYILKIYIFEESVNITHKTELNVNKTIKKKYIQKYIN